MKRGVHRHSHWSNVFKAYYYGIVTNFGSRKKVDKLNQETLEFVEKGEPLTILLHGVAANYHRSMYSTILLLRKFGIHVYSLGYDFRNSIEVSARSVQNQIQELMKLTGCKKINIIGICLGGPISRYYAGELGGKKIIDHLVTIHSPLKFIPPQENKFGLAVNKAVGGCPEIYNMGLKKIEGKNPVKKHLYIYSEDDIIISKDFTYDKMAHHICIGGGHLMVSYNPDALKLAADFILS